MPESSKLLDAIRMLKASDDPVFREGGERLEQNLRDLVRDVGELLAANTSRLHETLRLAAEAVNDEAIDQARRSPLRSGETIVISSRRVGKTQTMRERMDEFEGWEWHPEERAWTIDGPPDPPLRARVSVETLQALGGLS
jgi:hypothetical protein